MSKIIELAKKNLHYLKRVFLISVVVVIIFEMVNLSKTLDFAQIRTLFSQIPLWQILLLTFIGLISEVPEIGYDVILNKMLDRKPNKRHLAETSWITNTINNLVGFGGVISIGLRSTFYNDKEDNKTFANAVSKVFLFALSGLSFFSLLSFVLTFFIPKTSFVSHYWLWLLGGSLYFPLVFLITRRKKEGLLGGLKRADGLKLLLVSILEWSGVLLSFLSIGFVLKIPVNLLDVIPLFIAASVIGIASMMPGSIGSFDLIMIMGLSSFHLEKETIIMWLLLYRLFYYIFPFLLGVILFLKNLTGSFNTRFAGIPRELTKELAHKALTFLLYFSGIMLILSGTIPGAFNRFSLLRHLNFISFHFISQIFLLILGYLLILIGRGISARVIKAYPIAIVLIATTLIYTILRDFSWGILFYLSLLLVFTIFSKKELFRTQLVYSWEMKIVDYVILGVLTLFYLVMGVYNLPSRTHKKIPDYFIFPNERVWLLGFIGILIMAFVMVLLIHYLTLPKKRIGIPVNERRVAQFLEEKGGNTDSQLVFLGDKDVYFYQKDNEDLVMFQFRIYADKLMIMGDPSGDETYFVEAIEELIEKADVLGYKLVFYEVSEQFLVILHDFGFDFMKMGEAAKVYLPDFSISGKKYRGQRAIMNRFTKENYTFAVLQPPFDTQTMTRLKEISDEWLHGRTEKGFSLGFFNENYLARGPIAVVKNEEGNIVAFANIMPTYSKEIGTIDLMRYDRSVPNGVMDYLFIQLFNYMKEEQIEYFDLGMAPLANVGTSRKSFLQERIAFLIFNFGSTLYSFQGLKDYKEKYASAWKPKYTLYSRDSSLIITMIQLLIVDDTPVVKGKRSVFEKVFRRQ